MPSTHLPSTGDDGRVIEPTATSPTTLTTSTPNDTEDTMSEKTPVNTTSTAPAGTRQSADNVRPKTGPQQRLHFSDDNIDANTNSANTDEKHSPTRPPPAPFTTSNGPANSNGSGHGQRRLRASEEFDRRYDGPFGRPSMGMTRRRSSQATLAIPEDAVVAGGRHSTDVLGSPTSPTTAAPNAILDLTTGATSSAERIPTFQPEPPALNYTLRSRKMAIFLFWTVIVFDSTVMPIALYFGLWYGVGPGNPDDERLSANTVFSIVTAALGGASILEYFLRFWRLYRDGSTCRVSFSSFLICPTFFVSADNLQMSARGLI